MKLDVHITGLDAVRDALADFSQRRFAAAVATGLTRTAVQGRDVGRARLLSEIDRPTPYTQRALKYVPATARNLVATVGFDVEAVQDIRGNVQGYARTVQGGTPASRYLSTQIEGGPRVPKRFELALQAKGAMPKGWQAVPGAGARIDAFGNVSRGQIAQIIAQLGTELLSGYTNTPKSRNAKVAGQRKAGGQFIAVLPGAKTRLKPGIYQREFAGANLTPVLVFVKGSQYRKRFTFMEAVQAVADRHLADNISRAVSESAARLAASRAA